MKEKDIEHNIRIAKSLISRKLSEINQIKNEILLMRREIWKLRKYGDV